MSDHVCEPDARCQDWPLCQHTPTGVAPADHRVTHLQSGPAYVGRCSCGVLIEGADPGDAYAAHLAAARERRG